MLLATSVLWIASFASAARLPLQQRDDGNLSSSSTVVLPSTATTTLSSTPGTAATNASSARLRTVVRTIQLTQILTVAPASTSRVSGIPMHSNATTPTQQTPILPTTSFKGLGTGSISSCYLSIWDWYFSSTSSALIGGYYSVSTSTWPAETITTAPFVDLTAIKVTAAKTLCDGHPRGLGSPVYTEPESTVVLANNATTTVYKPVPGFTDAPCTIAPSDCNSLWSDYFALTNTGGYAAWRTILAPPCTTTGSTIPFQSNLCLNFDAPLNARVARLIYWPIRLANTTSPIFANGSNVQICQTNQASALFSTTSRPIIIPGTRTAEGPNTFVFGGVTITSPDVGIALTNIAGTIKGCGPTINTVITMAPNLLFSARATYGARNQNSVPFPMDLNDLNWICPDGENRNAAWTTQATRSDGCYQNVAADAYFSGAELWAKYTVVSRSNPELLPSLTIANNYRPAIALPRDVGPSLRSVFGENAYWLFNGVWDPPIVVTPVKKLLPTPEQTTPTQPLATITSAAAPQGPPQAPPAPTTNDASQPTQARPDDSPPSSNRAGAQPTPGQQNVPARPPQTQLVTIGSSVLTAIGTGLDVVLGTATLARDGVATIASQRVSRGSGELFIGDGPTVTSIALDPGVIGEQQGDGQRLTLGPEGVVVISGDTRTTISPAPPQSRVTIGTSVLPISSVAPGVVAIGDQTLTIGGSEKTIGDQRISLASSGLVIGTGTAATTIALPSGGTDIVTIGTQTFTRSVSPNGVVVLSNGQTTVSLSLGGSANTLAALAGKTTNAGASATSSNKPHYTGAGSSAQMSLLWTLASFVFVVILMS